MLSALWAKVRYLLDHPTLVVTFVQGVLAYAISQHVLNLSPEQTGVITGAVATVLALVTACLTTSATRIATALIGFLQAGAAFLVAFNFGFDTQKTATYIGMAVVALGLIQHSKSSPKFGPLAKTRKAPTAAAAAEPAPQVEARCPAPQAEV